MTLAKRDLFPGALEMMILQSLQRQPMHGSFVVERQTQEIGVRMALGATRGSVLSMVLGNGISLVTVGLVTGLAATMDITRFMSSLLIGISPWDVKTFAAIAMVLLAATVVASWIPAMRATRVEPIAALRYE